MTDVEAAVTRRRMLTYGMLVLLCCGLVVVSLFTGKVQATNDVLWAHFVDRSQ